MGEETGESQDLTLGAIQVTPAQDLLARLVQRVVLGDPQAARALLVLTEHQGSVASLVGQVKSQGARR